VKRALALWVTFVVAGCASTAERLDDPPLKMDLSATGLKEDEQKLLEDQLCAVEGVSGCELTHDKGKTTIAFSYRGSLGALRHHISKFPHPGLEVIEARATLDYSGFDNLAPQLEALEPNPEDVLTYKSVTFAVRVPDKDVKTVTFAGEKGNQDGEEWIKTLDLADGVTDVPVVAVDGDGNERELYMQATVDTLPPELIVTLEPKADAEDTFVISGKVEAGATIKVDGRDVPVDLFGNWSVEARWDPDKRVATIVAADEHGNEVEQRRDLKTGNVLD
jgi:hypothetical protein